MILDCTMYDFIDFKGCSCLQDVRRDVLCGEDVEGQRKDGGHRPGEERPVYPGNMKCVALLVCEF